MNISTHTTEYFILESGGHTHPETVNSISYTHQHMHSQVKQFQQIRKVQLIKFNPNRQKYLHTNISSLGQTGSRIYTYS